MSLSTSGDMSRRQAEKSALVPSEGSTILAQPGTLDFPAEIRQIQVITEAPKSKVMRRALLFWLRIYVHDRSDNTRVNLHIPIPIPLLGTLMSRHLSPSRALMLHNLLQESANPTETMREYLESAMAIEFIRVEDEDTTVVIGFD